MAKHAPSEQAAAVTALLNDPNVSPRDLHKVIFPAVKENMRVVATAIGIDFRKEVWGCVA